MRKPALWHLGLAVLGASPIVVWMLADAGLPAAMIAAREIAAGGEHASLYRLSLAESRESPVRMWILLAVCAGWFGMLAVSLCMQRRSGRDSASQARQSNRLRSLLLPAGLHILVLCILLLAGESLMALGLRLRAGRMVPDLARVSAALFESWPTGGAEIEGLGRVFRFPSDSRRLLVLDRHSSSSFSEGISYCIDRDESGDALLILLSSCQAGTQRCNAVVCLRDAASEPDTNWMQRVGIDWESRTRLTDEMYLVQVAQDE